MSRKAPPPPPPPNNPKTTVDSMLDLAQLELTTNLWLKLLSLPTRKELSLQLSMVAELWSQQLLCTLACILHAS